MTQIKTAMGLVRNLLVFTYRMIVLEFLAEFSILNRNHLYQRPIKPTGNRAELLINCPLIHTS